MTENKTNNEVVVKEETQPEVTSKNYAVALFKELLDDFKTVNQEFDMDFVYLTKWLSIDGKGNLVEKSNDEVIHSYGDKIEVLIAKGEQKFSLWGEEDSPEDGELIVAENTREEAIEVFNSWIENNPHCAQRYNVDMIQSRYIAYVIPVESLKDDMPKIYALGLAPTAKMAYGEWAVNLFSGAYKSKGMPKRTAISDVVVEISTISKTNKDKKSYVSLVFKPVEMFDVAKYRN